MTRPSPFQDGQASGGNPHMRALARGIQCVVRVVAAGARARRHVSHSLPPSSSPVRVERLGGGVVARDSLLPAAGWRKDRRRQRQHHSSNARLAMHARSPAATSRARPADRHFVDWLWGGVPGSEVQAHASPGRSPPSPLPSHVAITASTPRLACARYARQATSLLPGRSTPDLTDLPTLSIQRAPRTKQHGGEGQSPRRIHPVSSSSLRAHQRNIGTQTFQ